MKTTSSKARASSRISFAGAKACARRRHSRRSPPTRARRLRGSCQEGLVTFQFFLPSFPFRNGNSVAKPEKPAKRVSASWRGAKSRCWTSLGATPEPGLALHPSRPSASAVDHETP
jgi:hypothetical protein